MFLWLKIAIELIIALSNCMYHRQSPTTYGLATIHALQKDKRHIVPKTRP